MGKYKFFPLCPSHLDFDHFNQSMSSTLLVPPYLSVLFRMHRKDNYFKNENLREFHNDKLFIYFNLVVLASFFGILTYVYLC